MDAYVWEAETIELKNIVGIITTNTNSKNNILKL